MTIKVLGPGCTNRKTLERRTRDAIASLNVTATVEKVEDMQKIATYGILQTPGLVIDGKVVAYGHVPTVDAIKGLILKQTTQAAL
ncbi:MAG TPA: redox-active disulfide protein 2 [Bacteroidetes bacterium]|jgi:small redox-active disulfide protein 2|nr:redox-active disulfide protein 2 [Bacteroidota bacterium]